MLFQTLDDKKECVGVYSGGELKFDEIPSDIPQGTINVNWISLDYVGNINNPFNFDIGYKVKLNYSKLYLQRCSF